MLISALPPTTAAQPLTEAQKGQRSVWLHAQGESPTETTNVSTVYMGDTVDLFFAIDNPNKGKYNDAGTTDEEKHPEPQYDLNGCTVKIYFDPAYFTYAASNTAKPIDFTVPDRRYESSSGIEIGEEVPTQIGYFQRAHGSDTKVINGKTYNAAYAIIFFSGNFLPQKEDGQLWYNLCSLPLTPIKTGNTEVFIDVDGTDEYTLELFAKNATTGDYPPAFDYTAVNGGYHTIVIKDKLKPSAPVADPIAGTYTETQYVTLKAE